MTRYEYECDNCAACCCHFHVAVSEDDIQRDLLVNTYTQRIGLLTLNIIILDEDDKNYYRANGCVLLDNNGSCTVHATKPDVCRRFKPGDVLCQWARGKSGLEVLQPTKWIDTFTNEEHVIK